MAHLAVPVLARGPFYSAPPTVATTISIKPSEDAPAHKVTKVMAYRQGEDVPFVVELRDGGPGVMVTR
jgi:hypothetical protein